MARGRRSGKRANYNWQGNCGSNVATDLAVGSASFFNLFAFTEAATLVRTRGELFLQLDGGGIDERVMIASGIIIVSTNAAAAGIASLPSPRTDPEDDWLWFDYTAITTGAEVGIVHDFLVARKEIDSKAMRKVKATDTMVLVNEVCASVDATGTFDSMFGVRVLEAQ